MRYFVMLALVLLLIPAVAYAGHDGCGCKKPSCNSCDSGCKAKCDSGCKSQCDTGCKSKCDTGCKPKCDSCKSKCNSGCKPKCDGGCKSKCNSCGTMGCKGGCKSACNSCGKASCGGGCNSGASCAKPCACQAWHDFCGCGTVSSLCFTITACEGTAGPLKFQLRDGNNATVAIIELPGPIECYYTYTYTFEKPIEASLLDEAVLINDTEDPATLTSLQVVGMDGNCFSWMYVDHTCPGAIVGPGGCKRMVIY